jgi:hypothetical protein
LAQAAPTKQQKICAVLLDNALSQPFLYKQRAKRQSRRPYTKKSDKMLDRIPNIETVNITSPTSGQNDRKRTYDTGENSKIQPTSHRRLKHTADGETLTAEAHSFILTIA